MKNVIIIILITGSLFMACKKEKDDVSTVVPVGRPTITLVGPEVYSTALTNGSYTDPGAVAYNDLTGDSVHLSSPVSSDVDLSKAGFYSVTYSFTNTNGYVSYTVNKSRLILVTPVDPAQDISGNYERTANLEPVTITKYGTGLYTTSNIGGVSPTVDPNYPFDVYFGLTSDSTIVVPPQPDPFGGLVTVEDASYSLTPDTSISWVVIGEGFGTALRIFVKQ